MPSRVPLTAYQINEIGARQFSGLPLTRPLFLNSIPKCGTLLLRNILLMFVQAKDIASDEFMQDHNLASFTEKFQAPTSNFLWGHLNYTEESARILATANLLLLVRDPFDYVLSYTRFLYSRQTRSNFAMYVKQHMLPVDRVIMAVIFGNDNSTLYFVPLHSAFYRNALPWMGGSTTLVRYEDLIRHTSNIDSDEAENYFRQLLQAAGLTDFPADWRRRIALGSGRNLSTTARENLDVIASIPGSLTQVQQQMVELAAPGLRSFLGYNAPQ